MKQKFLQKTLYFLEPGFLIGFYNRGRLLSVQVGLKLKKQLTVDHVGFVNVKKLHPFTSPESLYRLHGPLGE